MTNKCYIYRLVRLLKRADVKNAKKLISKMGPYKNKILIFIDLYFTLPDHSNDLIKGLKSDKDLDIKIKAKFTPKQLLWRFKTTVARCYNTSEHKNKCGEEFGNCVSGWCDRTTKKCSWTIKTRDNRLRGYTGHEKCRELHKNIKDDKSGNLKKRYDAMVIEVKKNKKAEKKVEKEKTVADKKSKLTQRDQPSLYYNKVPTALNQIVRQVEHGNKDKKQKTDISKLPKRLRAFFKKWKTGSWKCWCYTDYTVSKKCGAIKENGRMNSDYGKPQEGEEEKK